MSEEFGKRVAELRRLRGMSQRDLAGEIRRSESWVSQVERGVYEVERLGLLRSLAEALGVSIGELRDEARPYPAGVTGVIPDGYDAGMTKIAISLPDEQVAAAKRAVAAGRASSVSAYVADALARAEREDSLAQLLDEMNHELGEPNTDAKAWAEAELRRVGFAQ